MKFIVITLLIALFVSFLFGYSEAQSLEEISAAIVRDFELCNYNVSSVFNNCKRYKHCRVINGGCWLYTETYDEIVARCDLPERFICNAYSNCHVVEGKCKRK